MLRWTLLGSAGLLALIPLRPGATPLPESGAVESVDAAGVSVEPRVRAVPQLDVDRYMGRWYEVARYPNRYQQGMVAVVATYSLRDDGRIQVTNSGRRGSLTGPEKASSAVGWVVEGSNGARWKVQFIWPLTADYWVIDLCPEYGFAVVGQPSRAHLWVLSRTPQLSEETWTRIRARLLEQGYDPQRLERTPQPS